MRAVIIGLAVALVSVPVHAQQAAQSPAQTMKTFASSADVAALIEHART